MPIALFTTLQAGLLVVPGAPDAGTPCASRVAQFNWKTDAMKAGKSPKRGRAGSAPEEAAATTSGSSAPPVAAVDMPATEGAAPEAVVLMPECTARNAEALKARLLDAVNTAGAVEVDVGAVERVDTVGLQLLAAFSRQRSLHGTPVAWRGRSDALVQAVALLGLGGTLAISDAA